MPTGQVFRWHCRAITHPIASSDAVPKPNSSAPRIAASTTSRANFRPPSTRRERRERRPARTSVSCVSRNPISQGRPVFLMDVRGEEPVPPPHHDIYSIEDLAQLIHDLREIFDAVNVVMRRRRNQRSPGGGMPDARNVLADLPRRQLAALAGLRALRHLDFELFGVDEVI